MTYGEFLEFVPSKCMYETIYDDSEGRTILVIRLLDAYGMVNKAATALRLAIDVQNMASESTYKAALAQPEERNFCSRCGKRTADLTVIHTCTPPQENT